MFLFGIALTGLYFWLFVTIAIGSIIYCLENDGPILATVDVAAIILALECFTNYRPIQFLTNDPLNSCIFVAAFFAIGALWMVARWSFKVYMVGIKFDEFKKYYIPVILEEPLNNVDGKLTDIGIKRLYSQAAVTLGESIPLSVIEHKSRLYMWWIFWPISIFSTFVKDFIRFVWTFVYNTFSGTMQRISNNRFKIQ